MDAHVVELAYTPVPKGRVTVTTRAQVQPVEHPRPEAWHPEQLPSQHQGAEGPDLGGCWYQGPLRCVAWEGWGEKPGKWLVIPVTLYLQCDFMSQISFESYY